MKQRAQVGLLGSAPTHTADRDCITLFTHGEECEDVSVALSISAGVIGLALLMLLVCLVRPDLPHPRLFSKQGTAYVSQSSWSWRLATLIVEVAMISFALLQLPQPWWTGPASPLTSHSWTLLDYFWLDLPRSVVDPLIKHIASVGILFLFSVFLFISTATTTAELFESLLVYPLLSYSVSSLDCVYDPGNGSYYYRADPTLRCFDYTTQPVSDTSEARERADQTDPRFHSNYLILAGIAFLLLFVVYPLARIRCLKQSPGEVRHGSLVFMLPSIVKTAMAIAWLAVRDNPSHWATFPQVTLIGCAALTLVFAFLRPSNAPRLNHLTAFGYALASTAAAGTLLAGINFWAGAIVWVVLWFILIGFAVAWFRRIHVYPVRPCANRIMYAKRAAWEAKRKGTPPQVTKNERMLGFTGVMSLEASRMAAIPPGLSPSRISTVSELPVTERVSRASKMFGTSRASRASAAIAATSAVDMMEIELRQAEEEAQTAAEEAERKHKEALEKRQKDLEKAQADAERARAWEIDPAEVKLLSFLGRGGFGEVHRGDWNGTEVAVKKILKTKLSRAALGEFKAEVDIMSKLRHPNIVLFMGACLDPRNMMLITEFCQKGSLFSILQDKKTEIDWDRLMKIALGTARGMNYLHKAKPPMIHRDLKSMNVLIGDNWQIKVADFGLTKVMEVDDDDDEGGGMQLGQAGTPQWMAPEIIFNQPLDDKVDVYAFGVMLWEVYCRKIPYLGYGSRGVVSLVGLLGMRPPIPPSCDPQFAELMRQCWQADVSLL